MRGSWLFEQSALRATCARAVFAVQRQAATFVFNHGDCSSDHGVSQRHKDIVPGHDLKALSRGDDRGSTGVRPPGCRLRDALAQITPLASGGGAGARPTERMAHPAVVARILDTCPMRADSIARAASCTHGRHARETRPGAGTSAPCGAGNGRPPEDASVSCFVLHWCFWLTAMGWRGLSSVDRSECANGALLSQVEAPRSFYAVILPTFNERNNLPFMIALIHEAFERIGLEDRYQVVIVDDNSPDGTLQVAAALQRLYGDKRLVLAPRSGKLGLGTAYRYGMTHVSSGCTHVFLMDADLSHNPSAIPSFIRCMETTEADIVTGTRYIGAGGVCGWDLKRKITSSAANLLTQWMVAPGLSDVTGSYRLYRRQVLEHLLDAVQPRGYVFQMEVMVRAIHQFHYRVAEVPIVFVDRMWYGESKLGIREIVEYLGALWRLAWLL